MINRDPRQPSIASVRHRVKKLDHALAKFSASHKYTTAKTNILRLVLLPYLRADFACLRPQRYQGGNANATAAAAATAAGIPSGTVTGPSGPGSCGSGTVPSGPSGASGTHLAVVLSSTLLLKWWKPLLVACNSHFPQLASLDKNCYLECISRIVSRSEWSYMLHNPAPDFQPLLAAYRDLLLATFMLAVDRLSVKHVPLAILAFAGKVFAYAFFRLPDISHGLAFLLNTKVRDYSLLYNLCIMNQLPGTATLPSQDDADLPGRRPRPPAAKAFRRSQSDTSLLSAGTCMDPVPRTRHKRFQAAIDDVARLVPEYMRPLMQATPRKTRFKIETGYLNSVYPPKGKIRGINETRGPWCVRWASLDSVDLFASFLRHYLTLCAEIFHDKPILAADELHVYALPGFLCVFTHAYEIMDYQLRQKAFRRRQQDQLPRRQPSLDSVMPTSRDASYSEAFPSSFTAFQRAGSQASHARTPQKLFRVLRDFIVNTRSVGEMLIRTTVVRCSENVLKILVCRTRLLETYLVDKVLEMFVRFVRSVEAPASKAAVADFCSVEIDWAFWIGTCFKLLGSRNISCELRGLSILYQCWDYIPDYQLGTYGGAAYQPVKSELATRLVSDRCWASFFGHYLPLVRAFYVRLLVWKVLGMESLQLFPNTQRSFGDSINNERLRHAVLAKLERTFAAVRDVRFTPEDPVMNKQIVIRSIAPEYCSATKKEPIRTLAYEIIDDAAYSCADLSLNGDETAADAWASPAKSLDVKTITSASDTLSSDRASCKSVSPIKKVRKAKEKFKKRWMGKLFKRHHRRSSESPDTSSPGSPASPGASTLNGSPGSPGSSSSPDPPKTPVSAPSPAKQPDDSLTLLQSPPHVFSSANSSPSLSSKSSSLSLLSSMASVSSPQSSASSLDFLDQFTSSSKYVQSIQKLQRKKNRGHLKFLPPELNCASTELPGPGFRFELVNNEIKLNTSYKSLRDLNLSCQTQSGKKFLKKSYDQVSNTKPRLPQLERCISKSKGDVDGKDGADIDGADGADIDIDVMASPTLPGLQTSLRINDEASEESSSISITIPPSSATPPASSSSTAPSSSSSSSSPLQSEIARNPAFFANGLYEYNRCVDELEWFVGERLHEYKSPGDSLASVSLSVDGTRIYSGFVDGLRQQIPWLAPEEEEEEE